MSLSVVLITKNEAQRIERALQSVSFADEWIVVDSGSSDDTVAIARAFGARVIETADWPGFGEQKNRALQEARCDWVLSLDADEWLSDELAQEIREITGRGDEERRGFLLPRRSVFIDRLMRWGDWGGDRVLRLFRREMGRFSDDVVHERLLFSGPTGVCRGWLEHHSVRSREEARQKMWAYSRAGSIKLAASDRGGYLRGLLHGTAAFVRSLLLRLGFLDGWRGLQSAGFSGRGAYLKYALAGDAQRLRHWKEGRQTRTDRFMDYCSLMLVDHGCLRLLYRNLFRLPGGLYRSNQPDPGFLKRMQRRHGIRTVISLRGENEQHGWYRLEAETCQALGIELRQLTVYSRGLLRVHELETLRQMALEVELPALVHCKSGADRAGFFSALFRHFRLGEPIEDCMAELNIKYGHVKAAKTGILDYSLNKYLKDRSRHQGFGSWLLQAYSRDQLHAEFRPNSFSTAFVDIFLRRE